MTKLTVKTIAFLVLKRGWLTDKKNESFPVEHCNFSSWKYFSVQREIKLLSHVFCLNIRKFPDFVEQFYVLDNVSSSYCTHDRFRLFLFILTRMSWYFSKKMCLDAEKLSFCSESHFVTEIFVCKVLFIKFSRSICTDSLKRHEELTEEYSN